MSIAKAVITGRVYRTAEKRFTQNNVAVSAFVINVSEKADDEILIRVISKRNALDDVVSSLAKNDRVLVEGRLQTNNVKMEDGSEKRIYEIDLANIEVLSGSQAVSNSNYGTEEIVKFESDEVSNELINEDEIPF